MDGWQVEGDVQHRDHAACGKQKRVFLKRGEGVQKRVFGPLQRKFKKVTSDGNGAEDQNTPVQGASKGRPATAAGPGQGPTSLKTTTNDKNWSAIQQEQPFQSKPLQGNVAQTKFSTFRDETDGDAEELDGETTLVDLDVLEGQHDGAHAWGATTSHAWGADSQQYRDQGHSNHGRSRHSHHHEDEDDWELAEFKALEMQLKKDVQGAASSASARPATAAAARASGPASGGMARPPTAARAPSSSGQLHAPGSMSHAAGRGAPAAAAAPAPSMFDDQFGWQQPHSTMSASSPAFDDTEQWHSGSNHPGARGAAGMTDPRQAWPAAGGAAGWGAGAVPDAGPFAARMIDEAWGPEDDGMQGHANGGGYADEALAAAGARGQSAGGAEEQITQPFVRALFNKQQQQGPGGRGGKGSAAGAGGGRTAGGSSKGLSPGGGVDPASAAQLQQMKQQLEEEMAKVAQERTALAKMRTELEKAANRLEGERQTWERKQAEENSNFSTWREAELARLQREKRVLEKQSKAILKLPTKKERSAVEAVEAVLEAERREGRAAAARHKLVVERLRQTIVELQEKNRELREEVRWHEAQQIANGWDNKAGAKPRQAQKQHKSVQTEGLPSTPNQQAALSPAYSASSAGDARTSRRHAGAGVPATSAASSARPVAASRQPGGKPAQRAAQPQGFRSYPHQPAHCQPAVSSNSFAQAEDEEIFDDEDAVDGSEGPAGEGWGWGSGGEQEAYGMNGGASGRGASGGRGNQGWWGGDDGAAGASMHQGLTTSASAASVGSARQQRDSGSGSRGAAASLDGWHTQQQQQQQQQQQRTAAGSMPGAASSMPGAAGIAWGNLLDDEEDDGSHGGMHGVGGAGPTQQAAYAQVAASGAAVSTGGARDAAAYGVADHRSRGSSNGNSSGQWSGAAATAQPQDSLSEVSKTLQLLRLEKAASGGLPAATGAAVAPHQHQPSQQQMPQFQDLRPPKEPSLPDLTREASFGNTTLGKVSAGGSTNSAASASGYPHGAGVNQQQARQQQQLGPAQQPQQQPFQPVQPPADQAGYGYGHVQAHGNVGAPGQSQQQPLGAAGGRPGYAAAPAAAWGAPSSDPLQGGNSAGSLQQGFARASQPGPGTAWGQQQQQQQGHGHMQGPAYQQHTAPQLQGSQQQGQQYGQYPGQYNGQYGGPAPAMQPMQGMPAQSSHHQQPSSSLGQQQQQQQFAPGADALVREQRHADGKMERLYASGKRCVMFSNGTRKVTHPDGRTTVRFANGDVKRTLPGGTTEYYYAEVSTWHTTHFGGVEVFHFPTGQVEGHHPGGLKEILFPDGLVRRVLPEGLEQDVPLHMVSAAVQQPRPADFDDEEA